MILYILLYSPDRNLKGLEDSRKSISVTFHAIVPKPLWDWDGTSCMHMRFDHKDLGKWHQNVGEFKEIRYMPIHTYVLAYYSSFLFSDLKMTIVKWHALCQFKQNCWRSLYSTNMLFSLQGWKKKMTVMSFYIPLLMVKTKTLIDTFTSVICIIMEVNVIHSNFSYIHLLF